VFTKSPENNNTPATTHITYIPIPTTTTNEYIDIEVIKEVMDVIAIQYQYNQLNYNDTIELILNLFCV